MRRYVVSNVVLVFLCATALAGCSGEDSAMLCVEQTAAVDSIAVSNRCNETIVVAADDGEKLIIASGQTHRLLGAGKPFNVIEGSGL